MRSYTTGGGGSGTVTSITPAADSGSGTAITAAGTLTVSGTTNEVESSVSGTTITVGLPSAVQITTSLTVAGATIAGAEDANTILAAQVFG